MKKATALFLGLLCVYTFGLDRAPFVELTVNPDLKENQPTTLIFRYAKEARVDKGGYCFGKDCLQPLKKITREKASTKEGFFERVSVVPEPLQKGTIISLLFTSGNDRVVYRNVFELNPSSETPSKLKFNLVPSQDGIAYEVKAPSETPSKLTPDEKTLKALPLDKETEFSNGYKVTRIGDDEYKLCTDKTCQVTNLKGVLKAFKKSEPTAAAKVETPVIPEVTIDKYGQAYSVTSIASLDAIIARNRQAGIRSVVLYSATDCGYCQQRKPGFLAEATVSAQNVRYYVYEIQSFRSGIPERGIYSFPTELTY